MKTVINLAITAIAVTLLAACGNNQKTTTVAHAGHNQAADTTTSRSAKGKTVSLKDDKLNAVYQHYLHLTKALTNGDVAEAKVAAQAIELGAKQLNNAAGLTASAEKISEAATIEAQRTAYAALSTSFIQNVKASGLSSGELYVTHCPMAMNDKGASWLSHEKEIKNPYFGESMLTCGSVEETIK